ncbi:SCO1860 family LAETG-anchored protein [Streptomyces sp. PT12]|uniref:SCO1860 family LAETG-anchored protein n=1 Tax=Streptomyces sp. PT12 TaxID=1510197 RepID=UPI000DE449DD|nr:SCO1860 family LAETG-anchored protein [Streptomyces sp. PT12]RBM17040.1 hypothetical protein DEH69_15710 [Streptomyces sp. PT12]
MNHTARRAAATLLTTAALMAQAALPAAHADESAPAAGGEGAASAAVLRAGLEVSLLDGTLGVPLNATLNEVQAPGRATEARETLLTATLDGVDEGRPFELLRADVADATATVDADGSFAETSLAAAQVTVPGLPMRPLIELDAIAARAHCPLGGTPVAETDMPAAATVFGQEVPLTVEGSVNVPVPGVGEVTLDLSRTETSQGAAAASALDLSISVNPLNLDIAGVTGTLTLAEASCETPAGAPRTQTVSEEETEEAEDAPEMAATGGGSATPYVIGGGVGLLVAGAATVLVARHRRRTA